MRQKVSNRSGDFARAETALLSLPGVSRETLDGLERYVAELRLWQRRINLISPGTVDEIWHRHILDSAQLPALVPEAGCWVDLGAGAGLPGLVLAILLRGRPGAMVHLVESNGKKAAFLRHVAGLLDLPATVHNQRIEDAVAILPKADVVTARALASLDTLLRYSSSLLKTGTIGLFPKGRDLDRELTDARLNWHLDLVLLPSLTEADARIVRIDRAIRKTELRDARAPGLDET
jgi:16S rRNA (guanine527-N7)-methyltransferase